MAHRGMDTRTALIRFGMPAIAAGIVLGGTLPTLAGGLASVLVANPAGLPWLFERVFAFMAYLALAGSVVYGLLLSTKLLHAVAHRPVSFHLHRDLALAGLGMAAVHGGLLALDASMPFSVTQILVPGQAPYAPLAVGVGQAALYLMALVVASFYVRRLIGQRTWRMLHYLTFLAFAGSTAHGIAAGTDSGQPWARWIYLGAMTVVTFLLVYRVGVTAAEYVARRRREAATA